MRTDELHPAARRAAVRPGVTTAGYGPDGVARLDTTPTELIAL